jgi:hypothetical protein
LLGLRPPQLWKPLPGPQTKALDCQADELFYGGAAGGGKTDLLLGLALTEHKKSLFLRRLAVDLTAAVDRLRVIVGSRGHWRFSGHGGRLILDGRSLELAGCEHETDKFKYQGRDHDLKLLDELPHFSRDQYRFIIGWNRTTIPGQRCRVVAAGNPPATAEARWVIEEWAPWLDEYYPDPAKPGELRWYTTGEDGKTIWQKSDGIAHVLGPPSEASTPQNREGGPSHVKRFVRLSSSRYPSLQLTTRANYLYNLLVTQGLRELDHRQVLNRKSFDSLNELLHLFC